MFVKVLYLRRCIRVHVCGYEVVMVVVVVLVFVFFFCLQVILYAVMVVPDDYMLFGWCDGFVRAW